MVGVLCGEVGRRGCERDSTQRPGANEAADEGEGLLHACSSFFGCFLCISLLGMIQEYFLPALSALHV